MTTKTSKRTRIRRETYVEIKKRYRHDAFCKEKLRDPVKAKELARHILKPEVVARIDIDKLQIDQDLYIEDDLKQLFSDVVYDVFGNDLRLRLAGRRFSTLP